MAINTPRKLESIDCNLTFGPATAKSGAAPSKNFGPMELMPYFIEVAGYEFT